MKCRINNDWRIPFPQRVYIQSLCRPRNYARPNLGMAVHLPYELAAVVPGNRQTSYCPLPQGGRGSTQSITPDGLRRINSCSIQAFNLVGKWQHDLNS